MSETMDRALLGTSRLLVGVGGAALAVFPAGLAAYGFSNGRFIEAGIACVVALAPVAIAVWLLSKPHRKSIENQVELMENIMD